MAAKTDVGRVRTNNEDNFQASDDLGTGAMIWNNNRVCQLGEKGALLVVADGMGGMNAGEVASEIAINTIRQYFAPENITPEVTADNRSIAQFMNNAVVTADNNIKAEARRRPETRGMGTTIVIAWLYKKHLHVSWCGDSRAYVYNPVNGLRQLSKDHSYVQELVDAGRLSPEDAFDFPESNIITRCLSDSTTAAVPDNLAVPYEVCDGDIVMLCTDGLCGLLRDNEITRIMSAYTDDMDAAVTALIDGACNAGGHDNVTVCLCQILSGGAVAKPLPPAPAPGLVSTPNDISNIPSDSSSKHNHTPLVIVIIAVFLLLAGGGVWWWMTHRTPDQPKEEQVGDSISKTDTISDTTDVSGDPGGTTNPAATGNNEYFPQTTTPDLKISLPKPRKPEPKPPAEAPKVETPQNPPAESNGRTGSLTENPKPEPIPQPEPNPNPQQDNQ